MRNLLRIGTAVIILVMTPGAFGHDAIQTNFVRSCAKSMTAPPQGLPPALAASICLCTIGRIVNDPASRLVLKTVEDSGRDYSVFQPDVKACVDQELPKYMQSHPEFLKKYILSHPDVLDSGR